MHRLKEWCFGYIYRFVIVGTSSILCCTEFPREYLLVGNWGKKKLTLDLLSCLFPVIYLWNAQSSYINLLFQTRSIGYDGSWFGS